MTMLDHTIFNERPESQDRAIDLLRSMGYVYVSPAEAEVKREHLSKVLFKDELRRFLSAQNFTYRGKLTAFADSTIGKAMDDLGDDSFELNLDDIEARIERVENQINDILTTEPYIYGELLEDEEKKQAYREQLQAEHGDYEQYLESLTKTLDEMLREGGVTLVWQMN